MVDRPAISRPLAVFLVIVALLLLRAADAKLSDQRLVSVIQRLVDADLEHRERVRDLQRVAGSVAFVVEPDARLCAAMAALALEDVARFEQALGDRSLAQLVALSGSEDQSQAVAALGDPLLEALLEAVRAEALGDREAAARRYGQIVQSSRLFHNATVGQVAQAGLERTR